jgi:ATP phosphoribosyltransferase regulatory subunit
LAQARKLLPALPEVQSALDSLEWISGHLDGADVSFDLADLRGYAYYSGAQFAVFAPGGNDALVRGGRYDKVGSIFGRNRPAVGFSLDVKALVGVTAPRPLRAAIRAPWGEATSLRSAVSALRKRGETVVCAMPGHENEIEEFHCDRELIQVADQWVVKAS